MLELGILLNSIGPGIATVVPAVALLELLVGVSKFRTAVCVRAPSSVSASEPLMKEKSISRMSKLFNFLISSFSSFLVY